jgi:transcriptional regulator with XRE-family HTH domain
MNRRKFLATTAALAASSQLPAVATPATQPQQIGKRFKRAREWRGLSLAESAGRCHLTVERLGAIEAGKIPDRRELADDSFRLSQAYNVQLHWLLTGKKEPGEVPPAA